MEVHNMGLLSKLIGSIVYIIKTPLTNGRNAYRYGLPLAAALLGYWHLVQGGFADASVAYVSIRYLPPTGLDDLVLIGQIVLGAAVLMGAKHFIGMVRRDL
jgi:hypothetical protein